MMLIMLIIFPNLQMADEDVLLPELINIYKVKHLTFIIIILMK